MASASAKVVKNKITEFNPLIQTKLAPIAKNAAKKRRFEILN